MSFSWVRLPLGVSSVSIRNPDKYFLRGSVSLQPLLGANHLSFQGAPCEAVRVMRLGSRTMCTRKYRRENLSTGAKVRAVAKQTESGPQLRFQIPVGRKPPRSFLPVKIFSRFRFVSCGAKNPCLVHASRRVTLAIQSEKSQNSAIKTNFTLLRPLSWRFSI